MKKILIFLLALIIGSILLIASVLIYRNIGEDKIDDPMIKKIADIVAGQDTDAGDIYVWNSDGILYVKYQSDTENEWFITETYLHIADNLNDFPTADDQSDLVPALFDHIRVYDKPKSSVVYEIDLGDRIKGDNLYIAANAEVKKSYVDIEKFSTSLPETVNISVVFGWTEEYNASAPPSPSYFNPTSVLSTNLSGDYEGWCIDLGRYDNDRNYLSGINQTTEEEPEEYDTMVFSSYEDLPDWLDDALDNEENLTMINWLLNQEFVGKNYSNDEVYTMGDVERAIWHLIDDDIPVFPHALKPFKKDRVATLVAMAKEKSDFTPGPGEKIGVIFAPYSYDVNGTLIVSDQVNIIMVDLPYYVYEEETAWGAIWNKKNEEWRTRWSDDGIWATYFSYKIR